MNSIHLIVRVTFFPVILNCIGYSAAAGPFSAGTKSGFVFHIRQEMTDSRARVCIDFSTGQTVDSLTFFAVAGQNHRWHQEEFSRKNLFPLFFSW